MGHLNFEIVCSVPDLPLKIVGNYYSNDDALGDPDSEPRTSSAMTALLPVLKDAVNLVLDNFDCSGSA